MPNLTGKILLFDRDQDPTEKFVSLLVTASQ